LLKVTVSILHHFQYINTLTVCVTACDIDKSSNLPHSHLVPVDPSPKLESLGYCWPCLHDPKFTVLAGLRLVTDRQTDTQGHGIYRTGIASHVTYNCPSAKYLSNFSHILKTKLHHVSKNVPPSTCYNLDIHDRITIIFGRNVTQSKESYDTLFSHLTDLVLLHYLAN